MWVVSQQPQKQEDGLQAQEQSPIRTLMIHPLQDSDHQATGVEGISR